MKMNIEKLKKLDDDSTCKSVLFMRVKAGRVISLTKVITKHGTTYNVSEEMMNGVQLKSEPFTSIESAHKKLNLYL